jgi:hypothetical protein
MHSQSCTLTSCPTCTIVHFVCEHIGVSMLVQYVRRGCTFFLAFQVLSSFYGVEGGTESLLDEAM